MCGHALCLTSRALHTPPPPSFLCVFLAAISRCLVIIIVLGFQSDLTIGPKKGSLLYEHIIPVQDREMACNL